MTQEAYSTMGQTTATATVNSGDTSITVASAAGFPASGQFRVRLEPAGGSTSSFEFCTCTKTDGTHLAATRGTDGTSAQTWASGSLVTQVLTAAALNNLGNVNGPFGIGLSTLTTVPGAALEVNGAIKADGISGATAASRYVGATASGSPSSGTFSTGDFVIDQSGEEWVCTSGGSPGTWAPVATPRLQGVGTATVGSPPSPSTTKYIVQASSTVVTPNGSGIASISFPNAFPTGVLTIVATAGDSNAPASQIIITQSSVTTSSFTCLVVGTTGGVVTTSSRINWMAYGW